MSAYRLTCNTDGCYWNTAHETQAEYDKAKASHDARHPITGNSNVYTTERDEYGMPYTKPKIGKSIAEQLWDKLDYEVEALTNVTSPPVNASYHQARGRALAEAVHLMSKPYYADPDAVVRQAMKRVKMKRKEISWEPTPGYRYNPPPPGSTIEKKYKKLERPLPKASSARTPKRTITVSDDTATSIKKAMESGLFSAADLAGAYKISEAEVLSISSQ